MKSGGKEIFFKMDPKSNLYFVLLKRIKPNAQELNDVSTETVNGEGIKRVRFADENINDQGNEKKTKSNEMDINQAHRCWGHPGKSRMHTFAAEIYLK